MAMTYPQQPHPQYPPPPATPTPPTQSKWTGRIVWIIAVVAAFMVGLAAGAGTDSGSTSARETVTVRVPAGEGDAPVETAPAGPATTISSGVYQVGVDVASGQYKTAGPEDKDLARGCYWARLKNDSGGLDAIIANGNLEGPGSFTINDGEFLELGGDCNWSKTG